MDQSIVYQTDDGQEIEAQVESWVLSHIMFTDILWDPPAAKEQLIQDIRARHRLDWMFSTARNGEPVQRFQGTSHETLVSIPGLLKNYFRAVKRMRIKKGGLRHPPSALSSAVS